MRVQWIVIGVATGCVARSAHYNEDSQQVLGRQLVAALDDHASQNVEALFPTFQQLDDVLDCGPYEGHLDSMHYRHYLNARYELLAAAPPATHYKVVSVDPGSTTSVASGAPVAARAGYTCKARKPVDLGSLTVKLARVDTDGTKTPEELQLTTVHLGDRWWILAGGAGSADYAPTLDMCAKLGAHLPSITIERCIPLTIRAVECMMEAKDDAAAKPCLATKS